MKKFLLVLTLALISFCAIAQNVSASFNNEPLSDVFKVLEKQLGCSIICNGDVDLSGVSVTETFTNASISDVLKKVIKPPLKYEVKGKIVVIRSSETSATVQDRKQEQKSTKTEFTITGRVVDKSGEPVIGAVVWIKDSQIAATTDIEGKYTLKVSGSYGYVNVSCMGFKKQEVSIVHQDQKLDFVLEEDSNVLEEAVAIGYGVKSKFFCNNFRKFYIQHISAT